MSAGSKRVASRLREVHRIPGWTVGAGIVGIASSKVEGECTEGLRGAFDLNEVELIAVVGPAVAAEQ